MVKNDFNISIASDYIVISNCEKIGGRYYQNKIKFEFKGLSKKEKLGFGMAFIDLGKLLLSKI